MEVEDVAGVGLASRRTAQQQGKLAVGHRLLGEVVIDDQGVLAAVAEELAHGDAGVGGDELQRRRVGSGGGNDDGVVHGAVLLELVDHLGDRRALLADGDIDADDVLPLLVDDGVDGNRGLAGLAVADDQLALAAADRDHGVDRLEAGLHRLMDRFTGDDAGRLDFHLAVVVGLDLALAVDGNADAVDHPADQRLADRNLDDALGALDGVAFLDVVGFAENRGTDVVFFEVENHAHDIAGELEEFAGHGLVEAMDAGNTVTDGDDGSGFADLDLATEGFDLLLDDRADFFCSDFHKTFSPLL